MTRFISIFQVGPRPRKTGRQSRKAPRSRELLSFFFLSGGGTGCKQIQVRFQEVTETGTREPPGGRPLGRARELRRARVQVSAGERGRPGAWGWTMGQEGHAGHRREQEGLVAEDAESGVLAGPLEDFSFHSDEESHAGRSDRSNGVV